jgi:proteasome lid subunit RPN8/RPN11
MDLKERIEGLLIAEGSLDGLGNHLLSNEALFMRGVALCEDGTSEVDLTQGIDLMISSAEGLDRNGYRHEAALKRVAAGIWQARSGLYDAALLSVRKSLKVLRKEQDDESIALAMAAGFLALIRKGERTRAKRTLLDLVMRYPVKQFVEAFEVLKEGVGEQPWLREDPETSEMFKDMPVHSIERVALNDIISRAREAHPNEFGAMLRGTTRITHIEPILDTATGRATVMFSLYDRLSQRSIPGEGVVHSHPSGSTRPSKADLHMFSRFPGINIIIGFPYTQGTMAAYDRLGNRVELRTV